MLLVGNCSGKMGFMCIMVEGRVVNLEENFPMQAVVLAGQSEIQQSTENPIY